MNFIKQNIVKITVFLYLVLMAVLTVLNRSNIVDWAVYFRFFITLSCFMVYFLFLSFKQLQEVVRPVNWLTPLRWLILAILALTTVSLVPSVIYQYYVAVGQKFEFLRQVSSVVGAINLAGTTTLLVMVFTYKKSEK